MINNKCGQNSKNKVGEDYDVKWLKNNVETF